MALYRALVAKGRWTPALKARLEGHATSVGLMAAHIWMLSRTPCPLLEKEQCVAYEGRPFVCRTLLSKGDPFECDPHRVGDRTRIVSRVEVARRFDDFEEDQSRKAQIPYLRAPISRALLFADRITTGDLDIDGIRLAFYRDFKENQ